MHNSRTTGRVSISSSNPVGRRGLPARNAATKTASIPSKSAAPTPARGAVFRCTRPLVRGDVHTNTIEGFWAQFKRSVDGTHHSISPKHLQKYLNEFAYRHNHRVSGTALFPLLAAQMGAQLSPAA